MKWIIERILGDIYSCLTFSSILWQVIYRYFQVIDRVEWIDSSIDLLLMLSGWLKPVVYLNVLSNSIDESNPGHGYWIVSCIVRCSFQLCNFISRWYGWWTEWQSNSFIYDMTVQINRSSITLCYNEITSRMIKWWWISIRCDQMIVDDRWWKSTNSNDQNS